jgi:amino acid transporter
MGCSRGLHQISIDGQFPRWFAKVNFHGVPSFSMGFTVVASILVVLLGGAVEIYTFSNVGYLGSFLPVLLGYYLLRQWRPDLHRPVRMPEFFKYIALVMFVLYAIIWLAGGLLFASFPAAQGGDNKVYYFLGWAVIACYVLFYLWRTRREDPRHAGEAVPDMTATEETYVHDK